ncbi:MAG TPA: WS/DGAT domain-containing protein, partial [Candidatus Dormibacteraeota bacterium]|nr:WS/DGAT domain-containing protein [Candidatus Dormibacteraeota bacterium]
DGVSGAELATVLFDLTPDYTPTEPQDWIPRPEPSGLELLAAGARDALSLSVSSVARVAAAVREPGEIVDTVRDAVDGLAEVARAGIDAAPRSPLNVPTGPHRRYRIVQGRLDDYKLVKNTFGGTVNDVVLSVVTGALARFLRGRGIGTADMRLRAAVPVSVRSSDKRLAMGNQITLMLAPLPVGVDDPLARLAEVRASMEGIKRSNQALGAATIAGLQRFAPPTLLAVSSRLSMSSRMYNILVTNVPGPQFPVYALGRRLLEIAPVAFLAPDHAVAIAIMSYDGGVDFGILADYDAVRDVDVIATGIADAIAELVALARAESEPRPARRVAGRSATPRADRPRTPRRAPAATARPRRGHGAG